MHGNGIVLRVLALIALLAVSSARPATASGFTHHVSATFLEMEGDFVDDGVALVLGAAPPAGHMGGEAHATLRRAEAPAVDESATRARAEVFTYQIVRDAEPQFVRFTDDQGACSLSVRSGAVQRVRIIDLAFRGESFPEIVLPFLAPYGQGGVLLGAGGRDYLVVVTVSETGAGGAN